MEGKRRGTTEQTDAVKKKCINVSVFVIHRMPRKGRRKIFLQAGHPFTISSSIASIKHGGRPKKKVWSDETLMRRAGAVRNKEKLTQLVPRNDKFHQWLTSPNQPKGKGTLLPTDWLAAATETRTHTP